MGREMGPWEKKWMGFKRRFNKAAKPVVKVANRVGSFVSVSSLAEYRRLAHACSFL